MITYVLLTDDNDGTTLVACPDRESAEKLGAAAVFGGGDVSAWQVPARAVVDWEQVREILRFDGDCADILDAKLATERLTFG